MQFLGKECSPVFTELKYIIKKSNCTAIYKKLHSSQVFTFVYITFGWFLTGSANGDLLLGFVLQIRGRFFQLAGSVHITFLQTNGKTRPPIIPQLVHIHDYWGVGHRVHMWPSVTGTQHCLVMNASTTFLWLQDSDL
jgi:hypothetical protein